MITCIYSVILFLGLAAILFTIHNLLGIQIGEKIYFGKILMSMQWPQGLVSHLVPWYGIILTGVLFLLHPIKEENSWALRFSIFAPPIVFPLILMMFASMGIQIKAYGMTKNRYYVLALGLWIFATMIYLSLRRNRNFIYLPLSLSIIILLSVLGPIHSYDISKRSQNNRLERILLENNMIKKGEIQATQREISREDRQSISSILEYFDRNHNFKEVSVLPKNFEMSKMEEVFSFSYTDPYSHPNRSFYYTINRDSNLLDISEYDFLYRSDRMYEESPEKTTSLQLSSFQIPSLLHTIKKKF